MADEKQWTDPDTGIEYPTITVKGRGTFPVVFNSQAQYILDKHCGVDAVDFIRKVQEWFPKELDGQRIPGRTSPAFVYDLLAACLYKHVKLTGLELAGCFELADLGDVCRIMAEAFSKTAWSTQRKLRESATTEPQQTNIN